MEKGKLKKPGVSRRRVTKGVPLGAQVSGYCCVQTFIPTTYG